MSAATRIFLLGLALAGTARGSEEQELREAQYIAGRVTLQERPFGFLTDPSTPSAGVAIMGYAFGLGSGIAADRPLPVNLAAANGSHSFSLAYGVTHRFAPFAMASFAQNASGTAATATVMTGATYQLTRPGAPLALSVVAAGVHEAAGAYGISALASASLDEGPLRLAANLRADKAFAAGRDAIDAITMLGVSYRALPMLRVGAEYVAQDLEELFGDDAEGGARQALGPSAALDLAGGRYQLTAAAAFGLDARSPRALLRAALAVAF